MNRMEPSSGRYYRPELDVLRFLAFLLVFIHHALPIAPDPRVASLLKGFAPALYAVANACGYGLSLFFVLSAFLIGELLLRERGRLGTVNVTQFYIRRVLRIWPLYYLCLVIAIAAALLPGGHRGDIVYLRWYSVFMGAWYVSIHGTFRNPMTPLWSISLEEQFYLFVPWIVKWLNRTALYALASCSSWPPMVGSTGLERHGHLIRKSGSTPSCSLSALRRESCYA